MKSYSLCGCRAVSAIPLPELTPWGDRADIAPTVEIRLGPVPERPDDSVLTEPFLQIDADGTGRLRVAGVASFLVRDGREIVISPHMPETAPDIRQFLFGTAFALLCYQRGWLPVHAGAVAIGGRALLLAGASGAGKSTLVAALARRGHRILADDISVVGRQGSGAAVLLPAVARPKLWRDSIVALGLPVEEKARVRAGLEKFRPTLFAAGRTGGEDDGVPIGTIIHLVARHEESGQDGTTPRIERLRGLEAMVRLRDNLYQAPIAQSLGRNGAVFEATGRISAGAATLVLRHRHDFGRLDRLAADIEGLAAQTAPVGELAR